MILWAYNIPKQNRAPLQGVIINDMSSKIEKALRQLLRCIDAFTSGSGKALSWLCVAMAMITTFIVVLRYGFNTGSILAQEAVVYLHGCLFLLGAAYTLQRGGHVRVDVFYRSFSERTKAWVNSIGGLLFLLPLCAFILLGSWEYVLSSWSMREVSPEPGGIPAVFLLKSLIPLAAFTLALQGIAEVSRSLLVLIDARDA